MVEILINTVNKSHADPIKDARGCWKKGYPVVAKNISSWGGSECLPNFVKVRITDIDEASDIQDHLNPIQRVVSHTIVEHIVATDTFKVRIHADPISLGKFKEGEVTEDEMQPILNLWEGKNTSKHVDGGVYAEFTALDVIKGGGHFSYGEEEEFINYTEENYDLASGEHDVELDMSLTKFKPEDKVEVEKVVKEKNIEVIYHNLDTARMKIKVKRDDMMVDLGLQVESKLNGSINRTQYKLSETIVDAAIEAPGGIIELTKAEYITNLINIME